MGPEYYILELKSSVPAQCHDFPQKRGILQTGTQITCFCFMIHSSCSNLSESTGSVQGIVKKEMINQTILWVW